MALADPPWITDSTLSWGTEGSYGGCHRCGQAHTSVECPTATEYNQFRVYPTPPAPVAAVWCPKHGAFAPTCERCPGCVAEPPE